VGGHLQLRWNLSCEFDRRCGHMSAPLEMGTLDGLDPHCAMHCASSNVATGEASRPGARYLGNEDASAEDGCVFLAGPVRSLQHIRTDSILHLRSGVESDWVLVALP